MHSLCESHDFYGLNPGSCSREEPFIPYIDSLPSLKRNLDGPFMMPIVDKYADMGTVVIGKVESGSCFKGQSLALYPNRQEVKVDQVRDAPRVTCAPISCARQSCCSLTLLEVTQLF